MRFGNPIDVISISGGNINVAGTVTNQQPQVLLGSFQWNIAANASQSYLLPSAAESLMLLVSLQGGAPSTPCKITVVGNTTGLIYFDQVVAADDWSFCPISPVVDASVTVTAVGQGGLPTNFPLTIYSVARIDPAIVALDGVEPGFETNRFQPVIPSSGGPLQSANISAPGIVLPALNGPPVYPNQYRIWNLSLEISTSAGFGTAIISTSGPTATLLRAVTSSAATPGCSNAQYGAGLILPVGAQVGCNLTGTGGTLSVSVVYDTVSTG